MIGNGGIFVDIFIIKRKILFIKLTARWLTAISERMCCETLGTFAMGKDSTSS